MNNAIVQNKLEVRPDGMVQIPGCEPISSLTSLRLSQEMYCPNSLIKVSDLLRCIPGAKLIRVFTPMGHLGSGFFVVLPSGPPPNENQCDCNPDWYKIMKECIPVPVPAGMPECAGFNYNPCSMDVDPFKKTRDPEARPNSRPLSNQLLNLFPPPGIVT